MTTPRARVRRRPSERPSFGPGLVRTVERTQTLAGLELAVTRRLDGLLQGDFLGRVSGPGSEAGDARTYQPGDDARRIDWNLTARANELHVRSTVADRELETWIVADRSASMDFGTALLEKRDLVTAAVAAFALRTARNGNRVGVVVAGATELTTIPARSGRSGIMASLAALDASPRRESTPAPSVDLAAAITRVERMARRRGEVIVVSDFLDTGPWPRALTRLALHHDAIAVQVVDPRELALPAVGMLSLVDTESGRLLHVQTNSPRLRTRYGEAAARRHAGIAAAVRAAGAEHLVLRTDHDWLVDVARYLSARRRPARVLDDRASSEWRQDHR
jgi:uncharacterized protein (DUF58 family)